MQPTVRFWEAIAVAGVLAACAIALDRPRLLVGTAGVLGWLLAAQLAFVRSIRTLEASLDVRQTTDRGATTPDTPVAVTLRAAGAADGLDVSVEARPSAGLIPDGALSTPLDEATTFSVRSPVVGEHALGRPNVRVADRAGLFVHRIERGPRTTVVVEPREPRNVHVGEGGRAMSVAYGEHAVDATGAGIVPAELREYTGEESAARIDWKATARLATPYVREFEAESDLVTLLVVDHREGLAIGPAGETALDYIRAIALGYLAVARSLGDPVGCYGVGGDGVSRLLAPTNSARGYEIARTRLRELEAAPGTIRTRPVPPIHYRATDFDAETAFGSTLGTFASARPAPTATAAPLRTAVRTALANARGTTQLAVFTDDGDRAAVREAVSAASRGGHGILVFLAPRVLYEPGALADLTRGRERYREFERFRRDLARTEAVRAFEVAPRDRIEVVLERGWSG